MNIHTQAFGDTPAKPPPHNIEAEQGLLGAVLVHGDRALENSHGLRAEHFYDPVHARIFEVACGLIASNRQPTPILMRGFFEGHPPVDGKELTVEKYLGGLMAQAAVLVSVRDYAALVTGLFMRREIKRVAEEMSAEAEDLAADGKPGEILARAEARLYAVAPKGPSDRQIMTAADAATQAITEMNEAYQRGDGLAGISTGLKDLDEKIGGLPASNLIVAAGRPGMGKSVLAINIAQHIASTGRKVAFFSLEMAPSHLRSACSPPLLPVARGTLLNR